MGTIKKVGAWIRKREQILIWILAAVCGILFLISSFFPKYAYQIEAYHVIEAEEENEIWIELTPDTVVSCRLQTGEQALCGVNFCFDWGRDTYPDGNMILEVSREDEALGRAVFKLNNNLQTAYSYAELSRGEELTGDLLLTLYYESAEENPADYPYVIATDKRMENSRTFINGEELEGDLLMYHATLRAFYPLVFDAKMFCLLFLAVGLTMAGKEGNKTKEKGLAV